MNAGRKTMQVFYQDREVGTLAETASVHRNEKGFKNHSSVSATTLEPLPLVVILCKIFQRLDEVKLIAESHIIN